MMSLALSVAVLSSSGGLLAERLPSGVRLLDSPTVAFGTVLGASAGDEKQRSLEAMTRGELEVERLRLLDAQPSYAPGLIVAGAGVAGIVVGGLLLGLTSRTLGSVAGIVTILGGVAALVTGGILLIITAVQGPAVASQLRRVEQRLNTLLQQQGDAPAGGDAPPPPPPPPGAARDLLQPPLVLLATF